MQRTSEITFPSTLRLRVKKGLGKGQMLKRKLSFYLKDTWQDCQHFSSQDLEEFDKYKFYFTNKKQSVIWTNSRDQQEPPLPAVLSLVGIYILFLNIFSGKTNCAKPAVRTDDTQSGRMLKNSLATPGKVTQLPHDQQTYIYNETCTRMLRAALFITGKSGSNPNVHQKTCG